MIIIYNFLQMSMIHTLVEAEVVRMLVEVVDLGGTVACQLLPQWVVVEVLLVLVS